MIQDKIGDGLLILWLLKVQCLILEGVIGDYVSVYTSLLLLDGIGCLVTDYVL